MLKNQKVLAGLVFVSLAFSNAVIFGNDIGNKTKNDLSGVWTSDNGDEMYISQTDGFLEIQGKDMASIYSSSCLVEDETAECVGSGINLKENKKFLYKSTFKIKTEKDNISIEESWEGKFPGGRKISGKTVFGKVKLQKRELGIERN